MIVYFLLVIPGIDHVQVCKLSHCVSAGFHSHFTCILMIGQEVTRGGFFRHLQNNNP